jgi:hypothetical protein
VTWPLEPGRDLNSFDGDWEAYCDYCYAEYYRDFYDTRPVWPDGMRFSIKRHPEIDGRCATFWHIVTEGDVEDARIPDMGRCERIGWPRAIVDEFCVCYPAPANPNVAWWRVYRNGESRVLIALRDFSYLVVVTERSEYVMLWTAFPVEHNNRRRKLEAEWRAYWGSQGVTV